MTVELVFKSRRPKENGDDAETRAVYNTVEEALLQAAHDEMIVPARTLRIEVNGEAIAKPADFKRALKVYRQARNDSLSINDQGVVDFDSALHLERMKGLVG